MVEGKPYRKPRGIPRGADIPGGDPRATRSYEARPLERTREEGLWKEYLAEVEATRGIRRQEQERLAQKIRAEPGLNATTSSFDTT